jgi:hypothetical protein
MIWADPSPTHAVTRTTPSVVATSAERPQVDHPITTMVMAVGAGIVGVKGIVNMVNKKKADKVK